MKTAFEPSQIELFLAECQNRFPNVESSLLQKAIDHAKLVVQYNAKTNLISKDDYPIILFRHTLDSLHAIKLTEGLDKEDALWIDMGSGGGFPVIPLAACLPQIRFLSIEPRAHRVAFLRVCQRNLALTNLTVVEARTEDVPAETNKASFVTSRALSSLEEDYGRASRFLIPGGRFATFKSSLEVVPSALVNSTTSIAYQLPQVDPTFHLYITQVSEHG